MTREQAETLARQDAQDGTSRTVPGYAEGWYETERAEEVDRLLAQKRAEMRRRGIIMPWWDLYRSRRP